MIFFLGRRLELYFISKTGNRIIPNLKVDNIDYL